MRLTDNSASVISALKKASAVWLGKTVSDMVAQIKDNTAVDTGRTRDGWCSIINADEGVAVIGNPLENAVWEEFGTGEYALSGDGRKNGWVYRNDDGEFRFTYGKQPGRPMMRGYLQLRESSVQSAESIFKEVMK